MTRSVRIDSRKNHGNHHYSIKFIRQICKAGNRPRIYSNKRMVAPSIRAYLHHAAFGAVQVFVIPFVDGGSAKRISLGCNINSPYAERPEGFFENPCSPFKPSGRYVTSVLFSKTVSVLPQGSRDTSTRAGLQLVYRGWRQICPASPPAGSSRD